jgi:hypothetical protein
MAAESLFDGRAVPAVVSRIDLKVQPDGSYLLEVALTPQTKDTDGEPQPRSSRFPGEY